MRSLIIQVCLAHTGLRRVCSRRVAQSSSLFPVLQIALDNQGRNAQHTRFGLTVGGRTGLHWCHPFQLAQREWDTVLPALRLAGSGMFQIFRVRCE